MTYCVHLLRVEHAASIKIDEHGRARLLLFTYEYGLLAHRQMDPRAIHCGQGLNRAGEFALESALEIDLFEKLACAKLLVFHQLETYQSSLGQSLRGERERSEEHTSEPQ